MAGQYIKLFVDCLDAWEALGDAERGRLVTALLEYKKTGTVALLDGNERFIFPMYRAQIDRESDAYLDRCEQNAANGKKGGRPRKTETEQNRKNPVGFSETEKSQDKDKDKDKDKDYNPQTPKGAAFDRFWSAYPKKVGKGSARKAFGKVKQPVETLLTAIERQKCSSQWSRDNGQYIPNPATWLNQGRWDDELDHPAQSAAAATRRYHIETIDGEDVVVYDD